LQETLREGAVHSELSIDAKCSGAMLNNVMKGIIGSVKAGPRSTSTFSQSLILACSVLLAIAATSDSNTDRPRIQSVVLDGTNLLIGVHVPRGLQQAILECRDSLDAGEWEPCVRQRPDGLGGEIVFSIPKTGAMRLMRIRAEGGAAFPDAISEQMRFETVAPMALSSPAGDGPGGEIVLHFSARIDGSDTLLINRQGILWVHRLWKWPAQAVAVNGREWKPCEKNVLTTAGDQPFLPPEVQFRSAQLEVIQRRDLLVMDKQDESLQIQLADTLGGSGRYEFKVHLSTRRVAPPATRGPHAILRIVATIDGSDELVLSQSQAQWIHKRWRWPLSLMVNDLPWKPRSSPILTNAPPTAFLPAGVDFSSARLTKRVGRDTIVLEPMADRAILHFADNPGGEAVYDVTVEFGHP
jgi:hypothetical protein